MLQEANASTSSVSGSTDFTSQNVSNDSTSSSSALEESITRTSLCSQDVSFRTQKAKIYHLSHQHLNKLISDVPYNKEISVENGSQIQLSDGFSKSASDLKVGDTIRYINSQGLLRECKIKTVTQSEPNFSLAEIVMPSDKRLFLNSSHSSITPYGFIPFKVLKTLDNNEMEHANYDARIGMSYQQTTIPEVVEDKVVLSYKQAKKNILKAISKDPQKRTYNFEPHLQKLKLSGLLPLRKNDSRYPIILKLLGSILTDGTFTFSNKLPRVIFCVGCEQDADELNKDFVKLGLNESAVSWVRHIRKNKEKETEEKGVILSKGAEFGTLILAFRISIGRRVGQKARRLSPVVKRASLQSKQTFLSGLIGGDGGRIYCAKDNSFSANNFTMSCLSIHQKNTMKFLNDIIIESENIGIQCNKISHKGCYMWKDIERTTLEIVPNKDEDNLIKSFYIIGYSYCLEKLQVSFECVMFLEIKQKYRRPLENLRSQIIEQAKIRKPFVLDLIIREFICEDPQMVIQKDNAKSQIPPCGVRSMEAKKKRVDEMFVEQASSIPHTAEIYQKYVPTALEFIETRKGKLKVFNDVWTFYKHFEEYKRRGGRSSSYAIQYYDFLHRTIVKDMIGVPYSPDHITFDQWLKINPRKEKDEESSHISWCPVSKINVHNLEAYNEEQKSWIRNNFTSFTLEEIKEGDRYAVPVLIINGINVIA